MAEIESFKKWLASGYTDRAVVHTVEILHPNLPVTRLANWDEDIDCTLENASVEKFYAGHFLIEPVGINDTTEQSTRAKISSADGQIYDILKAMNYVDRLIPIELIHRMYFHTDFTQMLFVPPARWVIHAVTVDYDAIEVDLRTEPLRAVRIGKYFTRREFPVLAYL
jgi:hypothetical protein